MDHRSPAERNPEVLADPVAERLLARASELDASERGTTVSELRAVAAEAGISASAFDAALAEIQAQVPDVIAPPRRRRRIRAFAIAAAILIAVGAYAVSRRSIPTTAAPADGPIVEETILLRCLSPGEAAELVRPLLQFRTNTIVSSPAHAPRVLTIRATPAQIQHVRSVLDKYEGAGAPSCATAPAPK